LAQHFCAFVVAADKGADWTLAAEQAARDHAANPADLTCSSRNKNW
jgi:hypothetical protein